MSPSVFEVLPVPRSTLPATYPTSASYMPKRECSLRLPVTLPDFLIKFTRPPHTAFPWLQPHCLQVNWPGRTTNSQLPTTQHRLLHAAANFMQIRKGGSANETPLWSVSKQNVLPNVSSGPCETSF